MTSLLLVQLAIVIMIGLNLMMVMLTLGVKSVVSMKVSMYDRTFRRLDPVIETYLATGQNQSQLANLKAWQVSRFVAPLIVERMTVVRGAERGRLLQLSRELNLVNFYLDELRARNRWQRARAAERLGYIGDGTCVAALGGVLADADETVRAVSARALARIGGPAAARALAATLNNTSELTRLRVAENLDRIGSPSIKPLVDLIETSLASSHRRFHPGANYAVQVLGHLRASSARPVLARVVIGAEDAELRSSAVRALGQIGDPDDVPLLAEALGDESWDVRALAASALGMIGDIAAIPALSRRMSDPHWSVRLNTGRALGNMGPVGEQALIDILDGDDAFARDRAAATLEARGITRLLAAGVTAPGPRGDRARRGVRALIRAGATRHLAAQAEVMADEECRAALQQLLAEPR